MRRRNLLALLGGAAAWPLAARAQQSKKVPMVGVLWHAGSAEEEDVYLSVLRKAFNDLGYLEEKNIHLEHRFPAENTDRFRIMARELVELGPDAIIAVTNLGALELKRATSSIPIVFALGPDPVRDGLVESLSHPGGNVTGLSLMSVELTGKRLELLKEAVPKLSRIGLLIDPTIRTKESTIKAHQVAAQSLGLSLGLVEEIGAADKVEPAFAKMVQDGVNGVAIGPGSQLFNLRKRIGPAALSYKLPAVGIVAEAVPYGLLLSFGQDFPDFFRRSVAYIDKILKGAKPADLPVEQPTKFKLVLNLKTAKALGFQMPPTLTAAADEVID
ncbi:ABC transporter substrate-binding protein [Bradyrhizobium sp.]|uniref:ABC transporter substrate-binding protein n=1 Tax=Bradyrhizobium sp. TaxID=376 RepID=UPI003BB06D69